MKKLASILVFVFAVTLTTQAQKKKDSKRPQLSEEQQTILKVKKMTLALDLSERQQKDITPLIAEQISTKKAHQENRKAMKKAGKKPTADEIFEMKNKHLDAQILMKQKMKKILTEKQFEKFEKMANRKMKKLKKKRKPTKGEKKKRRMEEDHR